MARYHNARNWSGSYSTSCQHRSISDISSEFAKVHLVPEISWSSKQPEITDGFSKQPFVKGIFTTHKTPVSACFAFQVGICCFLLRLACCILFGAFLASRHCVELQQLHWIGGDTERCGFASLEQCQCSPGCNRSLDQHESAGSMESTERWRLG